MYLRDRQFIPCGLRRTRRNTAAEVDFNDEVLITNLRQKQALMDASKSLSMVIESIENGMPEDFFTIDLKDAYTSLGFIIGEEIGDDLANEIFGKFCMGK